MSEHRPLRIGLALGSGSARGWAHIGVIRALQAEGIEPEIVAGASVGAAVGAAYALGRLDELEHWACTLNLQQVVSFLDVSLAGGLIKGARLIETFRQKLADVPIEELPMPFAAVACDLVSGREIWLREGMLSDAVRASIALPGALTPVERDGMVLVDGGLVNPVPVSLCRAMGADAVIAVDLNSDIVGRHLRRRKRAPAAAAEDAGVADAVMSRLQQGIARLATGIGGDGPSLLDILAASINIMQVRITRSRLAGDPAEVLVTPRLAQLGLLEFHRAHEAIEAGRRATEHAMPQLRQLLEQPPGH